MQEAFAYFTIAWFDPSLVLLIAVGTFAGIYIGAIPGLSVTMAVSILISFTFAWDVNDALCLMVGIFMGGVYGGSRSAILLNIPGAPSAIATALDGYPLAQRGEAGQAIGIGGGGDIAGGQRHLLAVCSLLDPCAIQLPQDFRHKRFQLGTGRVKIFDDIAGVEELFIDFSISVRRELHRIAEKDVQAFDEIRVAPGYEGVPHPVVHRRQGNTAAAHQINGGETEFPGLVLGIFIAHVAANLPRAHSSTKRATPHRLLLALLRGPLFGIGTDHVVLSA